MIEDTYDYALKSDPIAREIACVICMKCDCRGFDETAQLIADVLLKSDAVHIRLTPREAEIAKRKLSGVGVKQLAKDFGITMKRVDNIIQKVTRKIRWYQQRYESKHNA